MEIILSIDDTDDLDSKGTGEIASEIAEAIKEKGWGKPSKVTRHQLFVHPDIPYTSHNSAMCFSADIEDNRLQDVISFAAYFLQNNCAAVADPGLCVVVPAALSSFQSLIDFGTKAKIEVVDKETAYNLAEELSIHLSEHGGTGQGIIGALAGAGLRLSGNDGRFKGKIKLYSEPRPASVSEIIAKTMIDSVQTKLGNVLSDNEMIYIDQPLKAVLLAGRCVLLVTTTDDEVIGDKTVWRLCSKQELRNY